MNITKIIEKYRSTSSKVVNVSTVETSMGNVIAAADDDLLYLVSFEDSKVLEKKLQCLHEELNCCFVPDDKNKILQQLREELALYFNGKLKKFTVPLGFVGSEFQKEVWNKLLELPYASTQTYGEVAKALGRASSYAQAVVAACGANAHLLVVPCHRLVGRSSKGGFNSGIDRKLWLINHEKKNS